MMIRYRFYPLLLTIMLFTGFAFSQVSDSTSRFGWIAYPYVFFSPETNLAFGGGGIVYFRFSPDTTIKPSSITPSFYYTVNDQYDVTVIPEFYFGHSFYLYSYFSFGSYIDKFYGIGPDTENIQNPDYDHESIVVQINLQPQLSETFRAGLYSRYFQRIITDPKSNPFLTSEDIKGKDGGHSLGFGGVIAWDTRDHRFYPSSGVLNEVRAVFYSKAWGSQFDYNKYEVDLRGYHSLDDAQNHILGIQFVGNVTTSGTPFYDLALLGGSRIMRGYYQGRYRDRVMLAGQAEYRTRLFWRVGVVAFGGIGQVSPSLRKASLGNLLPSYGFGIRFAFDAVEKLDIRFDVGLGKRTNGVYFDVQQAF